MNGSIPDTAHDVVIDNNVTVNQDDTVASITVSATNSLTLNATHGLTVSGNLTNNGTITASSGASLIVGGTSTGNITYNVNVTDTNWHLIASPVSDEQYNDAWVTANSIPTSTLDVDNKAIATYDNTSLDTDSDGAGTSDSATGHWRYFEGGTDVTFGSGIGYSLKRTASGNYTFTGTYPDGTIAPAISQSLKKWNLIGNPYPSYIDIAAFITGNNANLSTGHQAVYVWDAANSTYEDLTTGYIHPGQAFFVNSNVASGTASFTEAMQSHQSMITFYKNSKTSIELKISDGTNSKNTFINYLDGKTLSLDPRFDIGMFDGVSAELRIYSHLIENNEGISFKRQALPNSNLESMIIPIGIKAAANTEISFSADALNLPSGIKVFIEDKVNNTFTRLDETNSEYKITLTDAINDVGRFYLHTKQSVLSVSKIALNSVSIFKLNEATLKITGLPQGKSTVSLFNILGKQVMSTSFETNGVKEISLPKLSSGMYFTKVLTESGEISKKIILE